MFATLGAYTLNNNVVDLILLYLIGVIGFGMRVLGVPVAPCVIGLILGPLAEAQFRRALSISQGDWTVFFTDPLSAAFLIIAALALLGPFVWRWWARPAGQPRVTDVRRLAQDPRHQGCLTMAKLLEGVRVLDLTNVLAGPFCCYQLAVLGAEVIKVETPGSGDLARQLGADPELNQRGMGASFLAQNAGKRSVTLNLKHAARQGGLPAPGRDAPTRWSRTSGPA